MTTPSKTALDLAVKPAGMTWEQFEKHSWMGNTRAIAIAYAADLDKADKVGREVLADVAGVPLSMIPKFSGEALADAKEKLKALLLPDPIDPDLLEAREMTAKYYDKVQGASSAAEIRNGFWDGSDAVVRRLEGIKRGRELAKEQDRG